MMPGRGMNRRGMNRRGMPWWRNPPRKPGDLALRIALAVLAR